MNEIANNGVLGMTVVIVLSWIILFIIANCVDLSQDL
jgi:hypothetical protein